MDSILVLGSMEVCLILQAQGIMSFQLYYDSMKNEHWLSLLHDCQQDSTGMNKFVSLNLGKFYDKWVTQ